MKSSPSIWWLLHTVKLTVKFCQFLWPSQKTWTLSKTLFIWLFQNTFLCLFLILTSILRGISTCFCGKAIINQLYKTLQVFFSRFFYLIFTSFVIDCWKRFGEWEKRKLTMKNNGKKVVLIIEILLLFTVFIIIFSYQELFVESFCIPWS